MSVAYLFPGQGSQTLGMGVDVAASCRESADVFERASAALGYDLLEVCRSSTEQELQQSDICQPAILTTSLALLAAATWLPAPTVVAGHSLGEYTAMVAVSVLTLEDAVQMVRTRGRLMLEATSGRDVTMAAVLGLDAGAVEAICRQVQDDGCCEPAAYNAATQIVVAGDRAAIDKLTSLVEAAGGRCASMRVSSAFHTTLMTPVAERLADDIERTVTGTPTVPIVCNTTAQPTGEPAALRRQLVAQLDHPVRWSDSLAYLRQRVDAFLTFGPGNVLAQLSRANDRRTRTVPITDIDSLHRARHPHVAGATTNPTPNSESPASESLLDAILAVADTRPQLQPALTTESVTVRYGELADHAASYAATFSQAGIGQGDRVVVHLPNCPELVLAMFGLWYVGAVPVAALPAHRDHEITHVVDASGAVAIVVDSGTRRTGRLATTRRVQRGRARLATIFLVGTSDGPTAPGEWHLPTSSAGPATPRQRPHPADTALLLTSGGSTGLPKLIARTHRDYLYNAQASADICGLNATSVYLAALPALHNFTLACPGILGTLLAGGTVTFVAQPSAEAIVTAARQRHVTITAAVPSLALAISGLVARDHVQLPDLHVMQVGGAKLLPDGARHIQNALPGRLQQVYGMAEGLICYTRRGDLAEVAETQGTPMSPADEIRIADSTGAEVRGNDPGELWTRGPYTITSYYGAAGSGSDAFSSDGWYRTGDLVHRHRSGNLVVDGRLKDVINRSGEKISAAELERLLATHADVADVAAVGLAGPDASEVVCVAVVPRDGRSSVTLLELRRFLDSHHIARYKFPERLLTLSHLPLTAVGKPDKAALVQLFANATERPA